jgi:cyclase
MSELRVLRPAEHVLAFYEGRTPGPRSADGPGWVGEALSLGTCSYALLDGEEALVYDTHVSVGRGREIRAAVEGEGATRLRVVLSHWHLDHVAGNEAFADCEVIASARTAALLARHREAIESGTLGGPPAIEPLIRPTRSFEDRMQLRVGRLEVELIAVNVHSDDATVLWLPGERLLLAGDTVEDPITYVDEPQELAEHLVDLGRLRGLDPRQILPAHGDQATIAAGGYPPELIDATAEYVGLLLRAADEPKLRTAALEQLLAGPLAAGCVHYFPPYEAVHRENLERVLGSG